MGNTSTFDLDGLLSSKGIDRADFDRLPLQERDKAFRELIPGYAGLPPQEQRKAMEELVYGPAESAEAKEKPGIVREVAGVVGRQIASSVPAGIKYGVLPELALMDAYKTTKPIATGEAYKERREEGRSPVYSALAPPAAAVTGVDLPSMEKAAREGRPKGVIAEAVVPAGEAVAGGILAKRLSPEARMERLNAPEAIKANLETGRASLQKFLREPPGRGGERAASMAEDIRIASESGDLPEIFRENPAMGKGVEAVGKTIEAIDSYQDKLWDEAHARPVERQSARPFDVERARTATSDTIEPEDVRVSTPGQIKQARQFITRVFGQPLTVEGADKMVRRLNEEIRQPPEAWGPIGARVRFEALKQLRSGIDDALVQAGEQGIREANQRWGALNSIKERMSERYAQEWQREATKPAIPPWLHTYMFANAHRIAMGLGARLGGMIAEGPIDSLLDASKSLAKAQVRPPTIPDIPTSTPSPSATAARLHRLLQQQGTPPGTTPPPTRGMPAPPSGPTPFNF